MSPASSPSFSAARERAGPRRPGSDTDIGLYFRGDTPLDTGLLLDAVKAFVDEPETAHVTPVGEWGPWIVGGGWLSVSGRKLDLLYRNCDDVARVIRDCRNGHVTMAYQPGHPHGFCSSIWMGEVALCRPLHDPQGAIADMKAMTAPYPEALRAALIGGFSGRSCSASKTARSPFRAASKPISPAAPIGRSPAPPRCCSP